MILFLCSRCISSCIVSHHPSQSFNMKTYEPLPLLECIKELTASHPSSPQKSLDMSDDEQDQDGPSLLDEFKSTSPTKTRSFMNNDIQITTIESEYDQVGNKATHSALNETRGYQTNSFAPQQFKSSATITKLNPCAKTPSHNAIHKINSNNQSSDSKVKSSEQPLGNESLQNLNCLKSSIQTHYCHSNEESQPRDTERSESRAYGSAASGFTNKIYCGSNASLSNIETLSPYVRTNEFINEILKSPVREPCTGPDEDQVESSGKFITST